MLNQFVIVGKVQEIKKGDNFELVVSIPRPFKNSNGEYEHDLLTFKVIDNIAHNVREYVNEKDIVGIKGRIQNTTGDIELICEKITFLLSSKKIKILS